MRTHLAAGLLVATLVAGACSDSPDVNVAINEPPPPAPTLTPDPASTPVPPEPTAPPSPEPTSTPTPLPTARCQLENLPTDLETINSAPADVDGDGVAESAIAYHLGDDPSSGWRVRVESSVDGAAVDAPMDFGYPDVIGVQSMGGTDLDGDGQDEMIATVGSGASAIVYGVFVVDLDECTMEPVMLEGRPFEAVAGASVGSLAGVRCDDSDGDGANDQVVVYDGSLVELTEVDGDQRAVYDIFERVHTLDGVELIPEPTSNTYQVDLFDLEGPIGRFDCPPLLL